MYTVRGLSSQTLFARRSNCANVVAGRQPTRLDGIRNITASINLIEFWLTCVLDLIAMETTRYRSVQRVYTQVRTPSRPTTVVSQLPHLHAPSYAYEPAVLRAVAVDGIPSHGTENSLVHFDAKTTQHFNKTATGEFICQRKGLYTVSLNAHQTSTGRGWVNFKVMYRPGEKRADVRLLGISTHTYGLTASALTFHWLSEGSKLWVEANGSGSTRFECEVNITCAKAAY